MERVIRERMTLQNQENGEITPQSLVNIRPVVAAIKEFIGSTLCLKKKKIRKKPF